MSESGGSKVLLTIHAPRSHIPWFASFLIKLCPSGGRDGCWYMSHPDGKIALSKNRPRADSYWLIVHAWVMCPGKGSVSTLPNFKDWTNGRGAKLG